MSISGSNIANSTAETPRSSRLKRAKYCERLSGKILITRPRLATGRSGKRLVAERGGGGKEAFAAGEVRQAVEPEQRDIDRVLIEQAHDHDVAGRAGLIREVGLEVLVSVDRARHRDAGEARELPHIDIDPVLAIEQAVDFRTDRVLELSLANGGALGLTGHDQTRRVGYRGLERLSGEEHDRRFHDGEDEREKRCRDDGEFNCRRAVLLANEAAPYGRCCEPPNAICELCCDGLEHGQPLIAAELLSLQVEQ